jgi:hypothetical protein
MGESKGGQNNCYGSGHKGKEEMSELEETKCPECGALEEELDFYINADGIWCWNCFTCGHSWCETINDPTEVDEEEEPELPTENK